MNTLIDAWSFSPAILTWFVTTAVQVTLLACTVLLLSRRMQHNSALRHGLLSIGLMLIVIAPLSTCCFQQLGLGLITIPTDSTAARSSQTETAPERDNRLALAPTTPSNNRFDSSTLIANMSDEPTAVASEQAATSASFTPPIDTVPVTDAAQVGVAIGPVLSATPHTGTALDWLRLALSGLLIVSVCGSSVYACRWYRGWLCLKRIVDQSQASQSALIDQAFHHARRELRMDSHQVALRVSNATRTPVVVGLLHPVIIVPTDLADQVSQQQLSDILMHELAHILRRDPLYLLLQNAARTIYWMHPLVLWIHRGLTRASEEICDNYVLQRNSSLSYSRTLLAVAEFGFEKDHAMGAIGVAGAGWSLKERIAGLLDPQRSKSTALQGRGKLSLWLLAGTLSLFLLATVSLSDGLATAPPPASNQPPSTTPGDTSKHIRGSGDKLEFRLHGRLLGDTDVPIVEPHLQVFITESSKSIPVSVDGDHYEVWLSARDFENLQPSIQGTCRDGRRINLTVPTSELRTAIEQGIDLKFQRPIKSITFLLQHNSQAVAHAKFQVRTSNGRNMVTSDASGKAVIELVQGEQIYACTAWNNTGLLGGFQFQQMPKRDPEAALHVVEMVQCEKRAVRVLDNSGAPVAGLRLQLDVATPPPFFNYLGSPDGYEIVTDANGLAYHQWMPKWKDLHISDARLVDRDWVFDSQSIVGDRVEVVVKKPSPRVQVEGVVSRGGSSVGGVIVEVYSFQGESEQLSDLQYVMTDNQGKFVFSALPQSTYCLFAFDERLVSESSIFIPVDPETGRKFSPNISLFDGYPITIALTSGPQNKPIAGQLVSLRSEYAFTWKEAGEKQRGATHRQIFVITNQSGQATAYVPAGKTSARVYTSGWRDEQEIVVKPGQQHQITLHRENDTALAVSGRLTADNSALIDWSKVKLFIQSVDGETSDAQMPRVDKTGEFRFETDATQIGCYAISDDGKLAGGAFIANPLTPFEVKLWPTSYLEGQLLNGEGQGIADQIVRALPRIVNDSATASRRGFSQSMYVTPVEARTDAAGKYRIGPLPKLIVIGLRCKLANADEEWLGDIYLQPDEERPPMIHRLGESTEPVPKRTVEEHLAATCRDARLGGYHAMAICSNTTDSACNEFIESQLLNYDDHPQVASYMQIRLNTAKVSERGQAYFKQRGWVVPPAGHVLVVAMNAEGKELGQATIDVSSSQAKEQAAALVAAHQPPVANAQKKWDEAFALAKRTNRRVWARVGGRYCGPCHLLSRWLDDHHELLDKEFVFLRIDEDRDIHGAEVAERITEGKLAGIPFFAFYDAHGERLASSQGPTGNIGFISGFEGKRHFRKMLTSARQVLSDQEVQRLLDSLED